MFDSLDEQIKHDKQEATTRKERILRWVMVAVVSILVFGGFYFGIRLVQ
jgi:hypothetical protein